MSKFVASEIKRMWKLRMFKRRGWRRGGQWQTAK